MYKIYSPLIFIFSSSEFMKFSLLLTNLKILSIKKYVNGSRLVYLISRLYTLIILGLHS